MIIPRQLSAQEGLPGYRHDAVWVAKHLRLTMNGAEVPLDGVCAYDLDEGSVTRAERDPDGNVIVRGDKFSYETVRGDLKAELREGWDE